MRAVLDEIHIYPVKSLPGIRVPSAEVLSKGLRFDRRWMLVDMQGQFITQRKLPAMSQFNLELHDGQLHIHRRGDSTSAIELTLEPVLPEHGAFVSCVIWDDKVSAIELNPDHGKWFSHALGIPCRLVYFPEENPRPVDPDYLPSGASSQVHHVSLADGHPILLTNSASLDDLNGRLNKPVTMERFRPNLVISGLAPFAEDDLRRFTVGSCTFEAVKRCARCNLITVDPQTGNVGDEPLRTLSTYRKNGNKVYFGADCIPLQESTIHEGNEITVF